MANVSTVGRTEGGPGLVDESAHRRAGRRTSSRAARPATRPRNGSGTVGSRREAADGDRRRQRVRRRTAPLARRTSSTSASSVVRVVQVPGVHLRHRVQRELECGDDAEAAGPPGRPPSAARGASAGYAATARLGGDDLGADRPSGQRGRSGDRTSRSHRRGWSRRRRRPRWIPADRPGRTERQPRPRRPSTTPAATRAVSGRDRSGLAQRRVFISRPPMRAAGAMAGGLDPDPDAGSDGPPHRGRHVVGVDREHDHRGSVDGVEVPGADHAGEVGVVASAPLPVRRTGGARGGLRGLAASGGGAGDHLSLLRCEGGGYRLVGGRRRRGVAHVQGEHQRARDEVEPCRNHSGSTGRLTM